MHLITTKPTDTEARINLPHPPVQTDLVAESPRWGRLWTGRGFHNCLRSVAETGAAAASCVVHDHGVWLAPNHAVASFCRAAGLSRVVSPRGMLSSWSIDRARWKKKLAWYAYQGADLRSATAFHVTSPDEADDVRRLGLRQPIAVIPNGISFPGSMSVRRRSSGPRRMLFLSRIHPKKGLLELVRAWKNADAGDDWELWIAGPDEGGHRRIVEELVGELGLQHQVKFPGAVNDQEKWQVYADADVFVLPSFSENFGIVIAEALAAGKPVITTTGTPWRALEEKGCGWWVEPDVANLTRVLRTVLGLPSSQLVAMGKAGAEWVRQSFQWESVAEKMVLFYQWLLDQDKMPRPSFVEVPDPFSEPRPNF